MPSHKKDKNNEKVKKGEVKEDVNPPKPYRPEKNILDSFYLLPELENSKRHSAIISLLSNLKNDPVAVDYCIERLIAGLASSRAAARIGFSTSLGILLESVHLQWPASKLFELADKKISLQEESMRNANVIGHHLLASSLINSQHYKEAFPLILERELSLYRKYPFMAMTICHTIGDMLLAADSKLFKSSLLPPLKEYFDSALDSSLPDILYLILLIRQKHANSIHELVSFVHKDGSCTFSVEDLERILAALKKCERNAVNLFIKELFEAARSGNVFDTVYKAIAERWACSGDETKVLERIFALAELALRGGKNYTEVVAIFSDVLMKRIGNIIGGKHSAQQKVLRSKISVFCNYINEKLADVQDSRALLNIITHLDRNGSFDQLTGCDVVKKLIGRLDKSSAIEWVQGINDSNIRRIFHAFSQWPTETKKEVIMQLMGRELSEDLSLTVANNLDSLFYVKVRAGERVVIKLSEENQSIIKAAVDVIAQKDVKKALKQFNNEELKTPLSVLYMSVKLWEYLAVNASDKKVYHDALREILAIGSSEQVENVSILIDLLISLLSLPHRFIRTTVYYVYVYLLPNINYSEVKHIIDSLSMDDTEIEADENIGDMEDDEQTDIEEDDALSSEDEEEDEESDDEDEKEDVDPQLVSRLEQALGKAAVKRKDDGGFDSDIDLSDMDDETMFAMDEKLADVFKSMNPRKEKAQKSQAMQDFRSKVTDLLLFTISAAETPNDVKLELIIPLLQLCLVQLKRKNENIVSKRTIELLNMLTKQKKIDASEEKILQLFHQLIELAPMLTNPLLSATIAALTSFIFSLGVRNSEASSVVKEAFMNAFNKFLTQDDGGLSAEIGSAAILKYPQYFVSEFSSILEAGFNEDIRIFRRTEALQCLIALLNKSVLKVHQLDKSSAKKLAKQCANYLEVMTASPSEVKPRFFATVMKVVNTASSNLEDKAKEYLEKSLYNLLETMSENTQLWKDLKKCNSACTQICGKQPVHIVKAILKQLH